MSGSLETPDHEAGWRLLGQTTIRGGSALKGRFDQSDPDTCKGHKGRGESET